MHESADLLLVSESAEAEQTADSDGQAQLGQMTLEECFADFERTFDTVQIIALDEIAQTIDRDTALGSVDELE